MVNSLQGDGKAVFVFFIGVIITIVFLATIGDSVFTQTTTASQTNLTVTASAINVSQSVVGRDLILAISVINSTNVTLIDSGVNLTDGIVNGVKTVIVRINDSVPDLDGAEINLTYTYNPDGFIDSAGGRSIADLIPLFGALAILIFGLVTFLKDGSLGALIRNNLTRRK